MDKEQSSVRPNRRKAALFTGIAALAFTSVQSALAECAPGYCEDVRILTLYTTNTDVFVKVTGTVANAGCTLYGGVYFVLSPSVSSTRFKEYYALLMAYQLADRPISFNVVPGTTTCTVKDIYTNS
jgi:hypothetical protein